MSEATVLLLVLLAFVAGWFAATVVWERAIRAEGMDPDSFRCFGGNER